MQSWVAQQTIKGMVYLRSGGVSPAVDGELIILLALAEEERYGYAVMMEVNEASEGAVKLGPRTLYRSIQTLLKDGLIQESASRPVRNEDQRRPYYGLTGLGRKCWPPKVGVWPALWRLQSREKSYRNYPHRRRPSAPRRHVNSRIYAFLLILYPADFP